MPIFDFKMMFKNKIFSISQVAKKFSLSRSTLLYYDSIKVLSASARSSSNYRRYSEEDVERLKQICIYRQIGLPLKEIKKLLGSENTKSVEILESRLSDLNREINERRRQQTIIVRILKKRSLLKKSRVMNKSTWVKLLRAAGLDDSAMRKWHVEFEASSPEAHQDFLESLGLVAGEIRRIRRKSAPASPPTPNSTHI